MLEKNLEECLNNAFKFAHENNHEFVTTEHLLLYILNNQDALNVLLACDCLLYTSPSPRDLSTSRMPSSA